MNKGSHGLDSSLTTRLGARRKVCGGEGGEALDGGEGHPRSLGGKRAERVGWVELGIGFEPFD